MIGVLPDQRLQSLRVREFRLVILQMQYHRRTPLRPLDRLHGELALPVRLPAHGVGDAEPGPARLDDDTIRDDERRIEADTELAYEPGVLLLVARQPFEELGRARACDRAEMLDEFVARHADTVVDHGNRVVVPVVFDPDAEFRILRQQFGSRERFEAELVGGVRCVRDQLAQENLLVAVQGVNHQLQELADFGLEAERLAVGLVTHASISES